MWDDEDVIMRSKSAGEADVNNCSLCTDTAETDMFVLHQKKDHTGNSIINEV